MKKTLLSVTLLLCLSGGIFAQDAEAELVPAEYFPHFTVAATFGIFAAEGQFEYAFNKNLSLGITGFYNVLFFMNDEWGVAAKVRWYPFGGIFNLGLGLGYGYMEGVAANSGKIVLLILTMGLLSELLEDPWVTYGVLVAPSLGWKIDFGKRGGLVLPIELGLNLVMGKQLTPVGDPGFDFVPWARIGLGYTF